MLEALLTGQMTRLEEWFWGLCLLALGLYLEDRIDRWRGRRNGNR